MSIYQKLINWFKKNSRDLPWRKDPAPYPVWISEIMLQQTQVKTVIPYFNRWMIKYPTIESLIKTSEEKILKSWQGLGYYHRARKIKKAAHIFKNRYQGEIPANYNDLITIPGIGDYTAKAILNFAFQQNHLAIDSNVLKIFSRLFLIPYPVNHLSSKKLVEIERYFFALPPKNKKTNYLFNEALFELGALICLAKNPLCSSCPLKKNCLANKKNQTNQYPIKIKKKLVPVNSTSFLIEQNKQYLLQQRTKEKRLSKMWEFPTLEHHEAGLTSTKKLLLLFEKKYGIKILSAEKKNNFFHFYTKYKINHHIWSVKKFFSPPNQEKKLNTLSMKFLTLKKIKQIPLTKASQKVLEDLKN